MSFKNITPEEYNELIKHKNRVFDLTFKTPERLNKYRNDKNINEEIKIEQDRNKKIKDYNKILNHNLNKYHIRNDIQKKLIKTSNYFDEVSKNASEEDLKNIRKMLVNLAEKNDYKNKYKFDNNENIIKSLKLFLMKTI